MKVAVTIWGSRVSPVFDSARTLLVVEVQECAVIDRKTEDTGTALPGKIHKIIEWLRIDVLICGALSRETELLFKANGVEVIPFITGAAEEILSSFAAGEDLIRFTMPGCPRRHYGMRAGKCSGGKWAAGPCCKREISKHSGQHPEPREWIPNVSGKR